MSYWDKFYKKNHTLKPSNFARLFSGFLRKDDLVIELGCGNGRDTKFLHNRVKKYTSLDFSKEAVNLIESYNIENVEPLNGDMSKINLKPYTAIYSRFSIHSISEDKQTDLFNNLSKCEKDTLLAIEVRSDKGAFVGDHYRRFINNEEFAESLSAMGYETLLHAESTGLSKYKDEDPVVIWYIGIKK